MDEIVYEPVLNEQAVRVAWAVPNHERARWDAGEEIQARWRRTDGGPPRGDSRDIQRLVVELEAWLDVDTPLESQLRAAHEEEPVKVTRLVDKAIAGAKSGALTNPGGWLWSRLKEVAA